MSTSAGGVSLEMNGLDEVLRKIAATGDLLPTNLGAALYRSCQAVMTDSEDNYVPVDTGVLKSSGYVQEPVIDGESISVTLGYGGAASAYAAVQHEDLSYKHTVGGPKYLELPLMDAQDRIREAIGAAVVSSVRGDDVGDR